METFIKIKNYVDGRTLLKSHEPFRNFSGGPPTTMIGGYWLMPWLPTIWPKIKHFPIRTDDVIILSFPKSGTNWIHFICYLIMTRKWNKPNCPLRVLEMPLAPESLESIADKKASRLIVTHLPPKYLPKDIFKGRVIYLYRNPKDVVVSLYHHLFCNVPFKEWTFNETFDQLARRFIQGRVAWGPYGDHVKEYYDLFLSGKPMLFLTYEDLKKDLRGTIKKVAEFLEKPLDDTTLDRIAYETSIEQMRKNKAVNWDQMKRYGVWSRDKDFFRKGIIGDWRNHFKDESLLKEFDAYFEAKFPPELLCFSASDEKDLLMDLEADDDVEEIYHPDQEKPLQRALSSI